MELASYRSHVQTDTEPLEALPGQQTRFLHNCLRGLLFKGVYNRVSMCRHRLGVTVSVALRDKRGVIVYE